MASPTQIPALDPAVGLPAPIEKLPPAVARELERRCQKRVVQPALSIGENVPLVGLTRVPSGPVWGRTPRGTWFYGSDFTEDPGTDWRGRTPVKKEEWAKIRRLRDAGLQLDYVFVVHEVAATWEPGTPLPDLVPKPPKFRRADAMFEETARTAARAAVSLVDLAIAAFGSLTAPRPAAQIGSYDVGSWGDYDYDPVILGGVALPDGSGVVWYKLAQWEWE
jgi:hypothetical protein